MPFSIGVQPKTTPLKSTRLPDNVLNLVYRNAVNIETCYKGIKERNLDLIFNSFINQPLCSKLTINEAKELFKKMCYNTKEYLNPYFNLDEYFGK